MKPLPILDLPPDLEDYRSQIESTIKPCIKIETKPESNMTLWQSKFGGMPYLPKNIQYPRGKNGEPLFLLAQVNFDEVPKLFPFPEHGILQFYIADNDHYGLDYDDGTKQGDFQVRYFPEVDRDEEGLVVDFDFLPSFKFVPVSEPCSLAFELDQQPISAGDYQFEDKVFNGNLPGPRENLYGILDKYERSFRAEGHKIGGYPYFTQYDPRWNEKYKNKELRLLLQVDTDGNADIMWGDAGVGNFFISESKLKKCDFSEALYNWDCC